jgi:hypothetical protein
VEIQVEVQIQLLVVSYLHCVEVVVQQNLQWQEKIQLLGYHIFMKNGRRTYRRIYLSLRIFGQLNRSQMKIQKWHILQLHSETVHWTGIRALQ